MKKIVVIMPKFRGYDKALISSLESEGFSVNSIIYNEKDVFDSNFFINFIAHFICLLLPKLKYKIYTSFLFKKSIISFNRNLLHRCNGSYDHLLVIKGFGLQKRTLKVLNAKNKVLYQWDSLSHYIGLEDIYSQFDRVYTFDQFDSDNGNGIFLPNFIVPKITDSSLNVVKQALFVGEFSDYRYKVLSNIKTKLNDNGIDCKFYLICSRSRFRFLNFSMKNDSIIRTSLFNSNEYQTLFLESSHIVELSHATQSGRTQRYFEALVLNKTVIDAKLLYKSNDELSLSNSMIVPGQESQLEYLSIHKWIYKVIYG